MSRSSCIRLIAAVSLASTSVIVGLGWLGLTTSSASLNLRRGAQKDEERQGVPGTPVTRCCWSGERLSVTTEVDESRFRRESEADPFNLLARRLKDNTTPSSGIFHNGLGRALRGLHPPLACTDVSVLHTIGYFFSGSALRRLLADLRHVPRYSWQLTTQSHR